MHICKSVLRTLFRTLFLSVFISLLLLLTACAVRYAPPEAEDIVEGKFSIPQQRIADAGEEAVKPVSKAGIPVVEVVEGDIVSFDSLPEKDADGDIITYTFTSPLDQQGNWNTEEGDEGEYVITISASDSKSTTRQDVLIVVSPLNLPPVIDVPSVIRVNEGELIELSPDVSDPEHQEVTITYTGWMRASSYMTSFEDAGTYTVTVTASDGKKSASKDVTIVVSDVNRKPELSFEPEIVVTEGDVVFVDVEAADPDGDDVTVSFEHPLDEDGTWQTAVGDAGSYSLAVEADDSKTTVSRDVLITVLKKNKPPVFDSLERNVLVTVYPGAMALVELVPLYSDPDGDVVTVRYSGWMTEPLKRVSYEDGGVFTVTITLSDGDWEVSENVTVTVNRAPQIIL